MADAADRVAKRGPRIELNVSSEDGVCQISNKHADGSGWSAQLTDAFGTTSQEFAHLSLMQMMNALGSRGASPSPEIVNAVVAAVDGVRPNTEIEAMLACQMAVTHALAMDLLGRANRAQHVEARASDGSLAVKLLRTYTAQVEALAKLQRGGAQTVRVEHVHVHAGGQAVVPGADRSEPRGRASFGAIITASPPPSAREYPRPGRGWIESEGTTPCSWICTKHPDA
jgi:hypothetical protein